MNHYIKMCKRTEMGSDMIEIKRDTYLQQLTMRKDNGMIKVITGIRRCGKSFLLFTIFKRSQSMLQVHQECDEG